MYRPTLPVAALLLCTAVHGQFDGGPNDGFAPSALRHSTCAAPLDGQLFTGGHQDGQAHTHLVQSNCPPATFEQLFQGGPNDGNASQHLAQQTCPEPLVHQLFLGGPNDGAASQALTQQTCPEPLAEQLFRGGPNDGAAAQGLIVQACPEPATIQLFQGGFQDGAALSALIAQPCAATFPMLAWRGGPFDGQGKGIQEHTICDGITPLPVELIAWEAECRNNLVLLRWSTATESDNDYFTIERGQDAVTWEIVQHVPGALHSLTVQDYAYPDHRPVAGPTYYRLSQTDLDGTQTRFETLLVDCSAALPELTAHPNPNSGLFTLKAGQGVDILEVQVLTSTGSLVRELTWTRDRHDMDLRDVPPGVYILRARTATRVHQLRVVIER